MTLISLIYKHYKPHEYKSCIFWMVWMASLSFAGLAKCESGPENRQVCRGCCFFWGGWISWGLRHQVDQVGLTEVLSWGFFHQQRLHQGYHINPEYQSWICWVGIQCIHHTYHCYETVYDSIYIYILCIYTCIILQIQDTEICVTDGVASLWFAGFARWETGPENPQGCGRCLFWWWMNFLGPEASGRSGRVDRSIVLRFFFTSSDCTRVQISILNMLSRYTVYTSYLSLLWDSIWQYIIQKWNRHDTEICVTDGVASLSFAGLARCESGPENQQGCRGCCFFLWWMNFLGPETSLSYLSYLSLSSLDITENESLT